jgi:hypothetical protein
MIPKSQNRKELERGKRLDRTCKALVVCDSSHRLTDILKFVESPHKASGCSGFDLASLYETDKYDVVIIDEIDDKPRAFGTIRKKDSAVPIIVTLLGSSDEGLDARLSYTKEGHEYRKYHGNIANECVNSVLSKYTSRIIRPKK